MTTPFLDAMRPFLTRNTFLGGLPVAALDALLCKGQECAFEKGDFIYRRGDPGDSLMIVLRGRVKLANTNVSGKEVTIDYLAAGAIFGETSALDGKERAVDAVALEGADIFVIPSRELLPTLLAHPDAMLAIIRVLCERSRAGAAIIEPVASWIRAPAESISHTSGMRWRNASSRIRPALISPTMPIEPAITVKS